MVLLDTNTQCHQIIFQVGNRGKLIADIEREHAYFCVDASLVLEAAPVCGV